MHLDQERSQAREQCKNGALANRVWSGTGRLSGDGGDNVTGATGRHLRDGGAWDGGRSRWHRGCLAAVDWGLGRSRGVRDSEGIRDGVGSSNDVRVGSGSDVRVGAWCGSRAHSANGTAAAIGAVFTKFAVEVAVRAANDGHFDFLAGNTFLPSDEGHSRADSRHCARKEGADQSDVLHFD